MLASLVAQLISIFSESVNVVPEAEEKAGVATCCSSVFVYVADATSLDSISVLKAFALRLVVPVRVIEPVYGVELSVGLLPFVV